jgi:hypothetical protein
MSLQGPAPEDRKATLIPGAVDQWETHTEDHPMATLTEKQRDKLPDSKFGLPEEHKYPMPDKSHARNAKARASQQEHKGTITEAEKEKIDRKADRILDK